MIKVYILRSLLDGRYYVGITQNLERRIKEHNSGKTRSTKGFRPWEFLESESFVTREEARRREVYLKSGTGKESIKKKWNTWAIND